MRPNPIVDVWYAELDVGEREYEDSAAQLSLDERAQAARFRFDAGRRRYAVRRGRLRTLLARHPDCGREDAPIVYNDLGKPRIEGSELNFSISHSNGLALYAFVRGFAVGCDIEYRRSGLLGWSSAGLFLSPRERTSMGVLCGDELIDALFQQWVRKEAYLKARGTGLHSPMQAIGTSVAGPPLFVELPDDDPAEWFLADLDLPCDYLGALAIRGREPVVRLHSWDSIS